MVITVDGALMEVPDKTTVCDLLVLRGEPAGHVLVEVNRLFVPPGEHASHLLAEEDSVEIILPAFGG